MSEEAVGVTMPSLCNTILPRRIKLNEQQLEKITLEDLIHRWHEQELYVDALESQASSQEAEMANLRESEERMRQQHLESTHREKVLVRRLATKEQEMQEYANQIAEFKAGQTAGSAALRSALLDPAVNLLLQRLRGELLATRSRLEETQNELSAWKFTPDSNTGKRLMAKCRLLYQENEELGRMISSGRLAKLEGELALQKSFSDEVKKSQSELDEFLQDLDEDVEGMQSTIYYLQQELRKSKEAFLTLQQQRSNPPSLETRISNPLGEKQNMSVPVLKEQSTSTTEEVKSEAGPSSKASLPPSKPSSPFQSESVGLKSFDSVENADEIAERYSNEGTVIMQKSQVKTETSETDESRVDNSEEMLTSEENHSAEGNALSESDMCDVVERDTESGINRNDEPKDDVDDQDSPGELMIEVGSEQIDNEDDDDIEEIHKDRRNTSDSGLINGLIKYQEPLDSDKEEDKNIPLGRRKRGLPEASTHSSDEDSDDTPLIKKVRRNHIP